jgi:hypothetical protein
MRNFYICLNVIIVRRLFTIIFYLSSFATFGQKGINGIFSFAPGIGASVLILNNNFNYRNYEYTCVDERTDTGSYEINHDTVIFHTFYKPDELKSRPIIELLSSTRKFTFSEHFQLLISNNMNYPLYNIKVTLDNTLLYNIDTLKPSIRLPLTLNTKRFYDTSVITLSVIYDTVVKTIRGNNFYQGIITISPPNPTHGIFLKEAYAEKLLYKNDTLYQLDSENKPFQIDMPQRNGPNKKIWGALAREKK